MIVPCLLVVGLAEHTAMAEKKTDGKPFQMHGTALWDNIANAFDPTVGASFIGEANATHLGDVEQSGSLFFDGPPGALIPGHGTVTLVAANGDELTFDYVGVLDASTGVGTGILTFTGGAGRFADATGTGEFYAEIDLSGGFEKAPMEVWIEGRVGY